MSSSSSEFSSNAFRPENVAALATFIAKSKDALAPVGGGTALETGFPLSQSVTTIDTSSLDRLVDFPARDMTVTVEAGMKVEEFIRTIAEEGLQASC